MADYHLDEGAGDTIYYSSANGLNGTLSPNGISWTSGPIQYSTAAVSTGLLPVGTDTLTAQYMGNGTYGAASASCTVTVNAPTVPTVTLACAENPSTSGQTVTFVAGLPSGSSRER